jgi:hypothetical protein
MDIQRVISYFEGRLQFWLNKKRLINEFFKSGFADKATNLVYLTMMVDHAATDNVKYY